ncbi:MAG TPA: hypothetical protein VJ853_07810, partial [Thermoanaerobaculia bacterium]|nr:hypothetical protein [Thermoanaerobaculia bacterium]
MKRLIAVAIAAAVVGALITYVIVRPAAKDADEDAKPAEQRITVENGEPTINIDAPTQQKIGLTTVPVSASTQSQQLQLFGSVVDVQELTSAASQIANARAQYDQAMAKGTFDRTELGRLKTLNADNKNVSDRAVQEAASNVAADDAAIKSAAAALDAAISAAREKFGPLIGNEIASQSGLYQQIVAMRQSLVQIAIPPGTPAPHTIQIAAPDGSTIRADTLGIAPRVDPKLQGASYFYIAPGGKLSSGMNVTAHFAGAQTASGVVVPNDAVVSFE